ncbi:hypothetical protein LCGC14_0412610 [marine sediment metagenome]|uniref:Uncharacterized protein n=1 Tax=marine sediment metagenome TaxID=412755 RepID=A0A0F9STN3_9ZZZZ
MISFTIPGRPVPFARMGGGKTRRRYIPDKQRAYMEFVRLCAARAMGARPPNASRNIMIGAVRLTCEFYFEHPASHSLKHGLKPQYDTNHHIFVPDVDNLVKIVKDALKGLAWRDDCQVCEVSLRKRWAAPNKTAGTVVTVEELA